MAVINGADNHTIIQAQKEWERECLSNLIDHMQDSIGLELDIVQNNIQTKLTVRPKHSSTVEDLFDEIGKKLSKYDDKTEAFQELEFQLDRIREEIDEGFWK